MQKSLSNGLKFLRQCLSSTVVNEPWLIQVRHGNARKLAVARGVEKRIAAMKGLPRLVTSRSIEKEDEKTDEVIVMSKDGRIICCWHPEQLFPYEFTKPIPLDVTPTDSNLKLQALFPVREVFRKKHKNLVVQELMQLTYTSKHRWFCPPKRLDRYRKQDPKGLNPIRDREFL